MRERVDRFFWRAGYLWDIRCEEAKWGSDMGVFHIGSKALGIWVQSINKL